MKINKKCDSSVVKDLETYFGARNRFPDLDEIIGVICLLTASIKKLVICIDGIGAATEAEHDSVWHGIRKIIDYRDSDSNMTKILISSESESKLSRLLPSDSRRIRIDSSHVSQDINAYVEARLQERSRQGQLFCNADLRDQVKTSLLKQADNMYVRDQNLGKKWVKLTSHPGSSGCISR